VVSIGVNRAGTLTPLKAAVKGARDFAAWAGEQGCTTKVLADDANSKVTVSGIFDAVQEFVDAGTYDQVIVYFSGHGILTAPGAEFWLLSGAPTNPNEAVNLSRSVEEARNAGIPHVVFVSDACRSSVTGPPLSGVIGGVIFPSRAIGPQRAEVDVFYATRPGDPAYEAPLAKATQDYRGLFTERLMQTVRAPDAAMIEAVPDAAGDVFVVTSRKLKPHLEALVQADAGAVDVRLRQTPELRVETALPKFFATVAAPPSRPRAPMPAPPAPSPAPPPPPPATLDDALAELHDRHFRAGPGTARAIAAGLADRSGLAGEMRDLIDLRGRAHFETSTGFSVHGAKPVDAFALHWKADPPFQEGSPTWHVRLHDRNGRGRSSSLVLRFESGGATAGVALAVLPDFIGSVVVQDGRVVSVSYAPSANTWRFAEYQARAKELEEMKAFAAVAARNGRFQVEQEEAGALANRIRQGKSLEPTLGLYASYAYAQVGRRKDVESVFGYMVDDPEEPVPFDVVMLATLGRKAPDPRAQGRYAPFAPMLSQGWALLMPKDPLHLPIHEKLRPHLVPSLWTTLDREGAELAREALKTGEVQ
jgi:hypothetical protein